MAVEGVIKNLAVSIAFEHYTHGTASMCNHTVAKNSTFFFPFSSSGIGSARATKRI